MQFSRKKFLLIFRKESQTIFPIKRFFKKGHLFIILNTLKSIAIKYAYSDIVGTQTKELRNNVNSSVVNLQSKYEDVDALKEICKYVTINNQHLIITKMVNGLPQRSALHPLIFLICISDLDSCTKLTILHLSGNEKRMNKDL